MMNPTLEEIQPPVSVRKEERLSSLREIIAYCAEYGFIFPSSEIYGGLAGVYDYGPVGVELKWRIREYWWRAMVHVHENIVGLDTAVFMHPKVWEASGHTDHFFDWFVDNRKNHKRYRVDHLLEFHRDWLRQSGKVTEAEELEEKTARVLATDDPSAMHRLLQEFQVRDPETGEPGDWTIPRRLELMFQTRAGASADDQIPIYLRPETAQGIYVQFLNVQKTTRRKIPFGIAQVGKAFRNELIFRQFVLRMREFEQMEMQFFTPPDEGEVWYEIWRDRRLLWYRIAGFPDERLRFQPHTHLAHYARKAGDIEYEFPMGWKEVEGIHWRTDYDLRRHQEFSRKKLTYFDPYRQEHYIPHVVETSAGLDRLVLMWLAEFVRKEELEDGSKRVVFRCPVWFAPYQVAVFPLLKKDERLVRKAREVFQQLRFAFVCFYEEKDSIGKRYRRHDAIGTPYAITVDHRTLEDNTVTIRDRDSLRQVRLPLSEVRAYLEERFSWEPLLKRLAEEESSFSFSRFSKISSNGGDRS